ncbi:shikimate dehydrogenase family protein [Egicoccus halophilus]|uniref:Shikimate dehydrogenase (NADP(+)) n=1 Tax=Egicoccus halophilus TaxID=1670830 RepID=A0A8J3AFG5_9ACTN|nr:shikimate dehydrogenase [Egicoccus halophilus]GGI07345.1 shikimate dehydrogenase (NADP(+)) [Egicoccus halophilus]
MSVAAGVGGWPSATTRPVVLLGRPVAHSLSPVMHNAAFRAEGLDLVYLAWPCPPDELAAAVHTLGVVGGVGANVTVPHKEAVVARCDRLTPEAESIGAVNTLVFTADGLLGDNTDAVGLLEALRRDVAPRAGDEVVVLGTGGAARAAAVAVARLAGALTVVGRRPAAAASVAAVGERGGAVRTAAVALDDEAMVRAAVANARIVVNATPLGLHGESLPAPFCALGDGQIAYDLLYPRVAVPAGREATPFLQAARDRGADAHHGLAMLVGQAAVSFERWTDRPAPHGVFHAAALAALGET